MTDPAPPSSHPADAVQSEHSGEFLRLARLWQHKQGHSWIFAAIESSGLRDQLIARLDTQHTDARLALEAHADPVQLVARLAEACAHAPRAHLVLAGAWQPDAAWWQQANTLRERLAEAFPKPLILWLPDACITLAARHAPDLWNWREAIVSFSEPLPPVPAPLPSAPFNLTGSMEKEAIELRLQDINNYLATHDRDSAAAAHLLLEAARVHERLGHRDDSMTCAQEAHSSFVALGNDRLAAISKGTMANIVQTRGQLDEALTIYQNEVLPVFDQLGDIRETAITKGRIADILQARGQLDQALAIYQNDVSLVFDQLGDIRSAAVTKGKIADILQARGQLDQALAIRQNEQLPVYTKLGDIRETAITKSKIADILQARGQLNEALLIWQEQVLPVFESVGYAREAGYARERIKGLQVALRRRAKAKKPAHRQRKR